MVTFDPAIRACISAHRGFWSAWHRANIWVPSDVWVSALCLPGHNMRWALVLLCLASGQLLSSHPSVVRPWGWVGLRLDASLISTDSSRERDFFFQALS